MTTCEPRLLIFAVHFFLLILPVAATLTGVAWLAWERERRWASSVGAALAGLLCLGAIALAADGETGAVWLGIASLPVLVTAGTAAFLPVRAARLAALLTAPAPALMLVAWSLGQIAATPAC